MGPAYIDHMVFYAILSQNRLIGLIIMCEGRNRKCPSANPKPNPYWQICSHPRPSSSWQSPPPCAAGQGRLQSGRHRLCRDAELRYCPNGCGCNRTAAADYGIHRKHLRRRCGGAGRTPAGRQKQRGWQGLFYIPFILILPRLFGIAGIYASQPAADVLTILVCVLSIPSMKRIATKNMQIT